MQCPHPNRDIAFATIARTFMETRQHKVPAVQYYCYILYLKRRSLALGIIFFPLRSECSYCKAAYAVFFCASIDLLYPQFSKVPFLDLPVSILVLKRLLHPPSCYAYAILGSSPSIIRDLQQEHRAEPIP